jgi:hypothetical protein
VPYLREHVLVVLMVDSQVCGIELDLSGKVFLIKFVPTYQANTYRPFHIAHSKEPGIPSRPSAGVEGIEWKSSSPP